LYLRFNQNRNHCYLRDSVEFPEEPRVEVYGAVVVFKNFYRAKCYLLQLN
jgi:hypothetical protein